ncbi:hypothetical protein VSDG_06611 [Cytospora chrysosperma]|uniref:3'-5' exonuclease domain-containing protein n=1 Tax=Cytospora chrysosperma TaxID=252740 RepID=A0A423VNR8_CYTCH|nr:hypothetical protein VSDG_06611 [Valsa sordida]
MDGRKQPSNWRLWHPNQGLVFQQPLYPALDAARFFTEASAVRELGTGPAGSEEEIACEVSNLIRDSNARRGKCTSRKTSKERGLETSTETARLISTYTNTDGTELKAEDTGLNGTDLIAQDGTDATAGEEASTGPPFTPLEYKMAEDAFYAANAAAEGTPESFWSYTLYRGPDGEKDGENTETKVKVHYCKSAHTAERVLQYFMEEKVIGFDLEWSPDGYRYASPRRNVSLVQIASQSRIALLHLAMYPSKDELATPNLRKIMENPEITKVGVWIKGDCSRLKKYLGIESRGIFELSHLFRQVRYSANGRLDLINKKLVSLADQVKEILRLPLFKGHGVRASDWSQALSMDQIVYSASDAYAGVHLFATLNHQREQLNPTPPLPFHAELGRPIPLAAGTKGSNSGEADAAELESEADIEADSAQCQDAYLLEILKAEEERLAAVKKRLKAVEVVQVDDGEIISSQLTTKPTTKPSAPKRSATKASKAVANDQVGEDDGEVSSSEPSTKSSTPKKSAANASGPTSPPKDPRVVAAETWLMEYKATQPNGKTTAGAAALRAYFIWYNNSDLDLESIGALLREPPLSTSTVMGYILQSVKYEKQPFDRVRLQKEVLDEFPKDVARKAYKGLVTMMEKTHASSEGPTLMIYEKEEE